MICILCILYSHELKFELSLDKLCLTGPLWTDVKLLCVHLSNKSAKERQSDA